MKRVLRRVKYLAIFFGFLIGLGLSSWLSLIKSTRVLASAPYEASDVIGQKDLYSDDDNFTVPSANGLDGPVASVVDSTHHRLFVSDSSNSRVLVYNLDSNNKPVDGVADYILGQSDFTSNSTHATANGFSNPRGLAYSSATNRLFVADASNHRVLVFDVSTITNDEDAINVLGQPDFTTGGYSAHDANAKGFFYPYSLAISDSTSKLFVADQQNHRVLVFDLSGGITDNMDASNVLGQPNFTNSSNDTTAKGFSYPTGVALDDSGHRLFVAEGYNNYRVLVFDVSTISDNEDAVHVLGQADFTSTGSDTTSKGFNSPEGVAYDSSSDRLFVSESGNSRVLVFDVSSISDNMDASNVLGQADFTTGTSDTNAKGFKSPYGVAVSTNNVLYVSEYSNNRVLQFDISSISDNQDAESQIGQTGFTTGYPNRTQIPNEKGFSYDGISPVVDHVHHRLFASNYGNCRILVFNLDSSNNLIDKDADYVLGEPDFNTKNCSTNASSLSNTGGLAYDSVHDRLFAADSGACRVMVFDTASITNGESAINILGGTDINSSGDCGLSASTFDGSSDNTAIAYDENTKWLYVADTQVSCRILVFDLSGGITDGMDASHVLGAPDLTTSGDCVASSTGFTQYYTGLALDQDAHMLYLAIGQDNRVLVFDVASITDGEPAVHVLGQPDFDTTDPNTNQSGLDYPFGLGIDTEQKLLFVTEYNNARAMIFDVSSITDGEDAVGVLGAPDFDTAGDAAASPTGVYPYDGANMYYDSGNRRLYLGDDGNDRITIFNFANITNSSLSSATVDSSYSDSIDYTGTQGTKTFSITSGSLPPGVVLGASTGALTGTPTTAGTYNFTVQLADDNDPVGTYYDTQSYSLTVANASSGSSSSGSSSSSSKSNNSSSGSSGDEQTNSSTINLGGDPDLLTTLGKTVADLKVGDVIEYCLVTTNTECDSTDSDYHTITIKAIDLTDPANPVVTATFASTPFDKDFTLDQSYDLDVTGDSKADINVLLASVSGSKATFNLRVLAQATTPVTTTAKNTTTPTSPSQKSGFKIWLWFVASGLLLVLLMIYLIRKSRDKNDPYDYGGGSSGSSNNTSNFAPPTTPTSPPTTFQPISYKPNPTPSYFMNDINSSQSN